MALSLKRPEPSIDVSPEPARVLTPQVIWNLIKTGIIRVVLVIGGTGIGIQARSVLTECLWIEWFHMRFLEYGA